MIALGAALVPILVTPAQGQNVLSTTPTTGTVSVPNSGSFHDTLVTTGATNPLDPITYTLDNSGQSTDFIIGPSTGLISTTGTLAAGPYSISGTTTDADLDSGTWGYTLTVNATPITQSAPTTNSTTPAASSSFTNQLETSGGTGTVRD